MNNTCRMNTFLQRMLRTSNEELNKSVESEEKVERNNDSFRSGSSTKGSWIKKLGTYSPSKYKVLGSPMRSSTMTRLDSGFSSGYLCGTPKKASPHSPRSPSEIPDLESIVREFEKGFLSPTKQQQQYQQPDVTTDPVKQRNFVKKIVAAFEVKYKSSNETKIEHDVLQLERQSTEEKRLSLGSFLNSPEKNLGISTSPIAKSFCEESKVAGEKSEEGRRSGVFSSQFNDSRVENNRQEKSRVFSSPFIARSASKDPDRRSGIYMSPINVQRQDSEGSATAEYVDMSFAELNRESSIIAGGRSSFLHKPLSLDDTKCIDDLDLNATFPQAEETIPLESHLLNETLESSFDNFSTIERTSTKISTLDRSPKIVGAFLKKPIEVEDTSIDWIPITGKKLPRKRSLKKLLSALTGRKSTQKKNKSLFSSERNLCEEPRDLQDSGYDERSCSSSSLTSLISITDALLHQENSYVGPERRSTALTTFSRTISSTAEKAEEEEEEEDEAFQDTYGVKRSKKKLLLTEVPREELKVDLGPMYPTATKLATMSLDRRSHCKPKEHSLSPVYHVPITRVPKHPYASRIPKHPFVSLTKMDDAPETTEPYSEASVTIRNDLYEVEFRRGSHDEYISSLASTDRASSGGSIYDEPRRFLSKSEPEIPAMCRRRDADALRRGERIYDVPRAARLERPRSSVYEDALSLKRRTANLTMSAPASFYSANTNSESHYATVKHRSKRIYLSRDMLSSMADFTAMERSSSF